MADGDRPAFRRVFVANRGEVAVRIARTCDALGITPVFGVSEADADAPYTRDRETVVLGPPRASTSYLDPARVVQAAVQARCTALHPGWGFLSENARFATLCAQHGVTFVGPPAHVIDLMGRKLPAKRAMAEAGLKVIPGSRGLLADLDEARAVAGEVGYPVLLKANAGGGGRGMRRAERAADLDRAFQEAAAEGQAAFGDPRLYLEKLIEGGRHVEIQVLADRYGEATHLGERDCTVQRNHQKLIEESPSPVLSPEERAQTLEAAVAATRHLAYVGAGTLEFLLDADGTLRFMEMNTRLQVEHPVSEMRTGVDLVAEQLRIAAGQPLRVDAEELAFEGHAIECRINAEDPTQGFRPSPGRIERWSVPGADDADVRVETHVEAGYVVPPHYDSLIAKVITRGETRDDAADRMIRVLEGLTVEGVATTVPLHLAVLRSDAFREHRYDTRTLPGWPPAS
ncbi:MAG: acetyl/propionyl/methylcrotonyl-CoA carboxylase subunit alpha [Sandaracinaceae bacterium]